MKQRLWFGVGCGLLGALVVAWAMHAPPPRVNAQDPPPSVQDQGRRGDTGPRKGDSGDKNAPPLPLAASGLSDFTPDEMVNIAVYENVNRSVVNINTKGVREGDFFFLDTPIEGAGSGSVLDKAGHILTNYHVVEEAHEIEVTLFDGSSYRAKLVGQDPTNDLAVVQIEAAAKLLVPVTFGDSSRLRVGQRVFAIGNPFGLERTLTTGIISSLNRRIPGRRGRTLKSIVQTDAAINPGNSGGPLLDSHGRLIGVNTAIASRTGQNTGIGFAIPVNSVTRIVPQLIEKGHVVRPEIGIAKVYEIDGGLMIAELVPGGPAERAGLRGPKIVVQRRQRGDFVFERQTVDRSTADVIVAVEGTRIGTADEFLSEIEAKQPGEEVTVTVIRNGRETPVRVRLRESEE